ncbi:MAG: Sec-independent protein translocase subunit TatA [Actinomycetota bacterium]
MARLFDNPMVLIILLVVLLLLFGAPKLPGMARSLGQSMRIFKSEVKELTADDPEAPEPDPKGTGLDPEASPGAKGASGDRTEHRTGSRN